MSDENRIALVQPGILTSKQEWEARCLLAAQAAAWEVAGDTTQANNALNLARVSFARQVLVSPERFRQTFSLTAAAVLGDSAVNPQSFPAIDTLKTAFLQGWTALSGAALASGA